MTVPTDEELGGIYDEAQHRAHVPYEPGNITGHRAGIAAVRKAIIDGMAAEADEWNITYTTRVGIFRSERMKLSDWLRSHLTQ